MAAERIEIAGMEDGGKLTIRVMDGEGQGPGGMELPGIEIFVDRNSVGGAKAETRLPTLEEWNRYFPDIQQRTEGLL